MYKNIMVPLDGSVLAECVLPHVEAFVKSCHVSNVGFVRLVEPPATFYSGDYPISPDLLITSEAARNAAAKEYLDQIVTRLKHEKAILQSEVLIGRVADSLSDFIEANNFDLILMATHGRSGVKRWVMGSIADKILRFSNIPVLMVRAPGSAEGVEAEK